MTILHVTDLHFNQRWFDWLRHRAPAHDLLVISGDLLDLVDRTPQRAQIEWVSRWLSSHPHPLVVCSGKHDLEWDPVEERWRPAYWLRALARPGLWTDGDTADFDGLSVLSIGATTRPKGGAADCWVVHTPPSRTAVATRRSGGDAGDPRLAAAVQHYRPRLVFSGHVHAPLHWCGQSGGTLVLNPGHEAAAEFPSHILVHTDPLTCELIRAGAPREIFVLATPLPAGRADAAAILPREDERARAPVFSPPSQPELLLSTSDHSHP